MKIKNFKLLQRKEIWLPTKKGFLLFGFLLFLFGWLFILKVVPFLSPTIPIRGKILVVEGWLSDEVLEKAKIEFQNNSYQWLITTGGPLARGTHLSSYSSHAELTAHILKKLGVDPKKIIAVPAPYSKRDRTYASALALKKWLQENNFSDQSLDVFTLGVHGRRSWILFNLALEKETGIISTKNPNYNSEKWWSSSSGVRAVLGELIAYLYVKTIFSPAES